MEEMILHDGKPEVSNIPIMQHLIDVLGFKRYLEIGIKEGITFFTLKINEKIGVEPKIIPALALNKLIFEEVHKLTGCPLPHTFIYNKTSDEFFNDYIMTGPDPNGPTGTMVEWGINGKFDLIYIDGLHTSDQAFRDIENSLKILKEDGLILVHDTNPNNEWVPEKGKPDVGEWSGDVWRAIAKLRCTREDISVFTADVPFGLTLIKKIETKQDLLSQEYMTLDYKGFQEKKREILNLKSFKEVMTPRPISVM